VNEEGVGFCHIAVHSTSGEIMIGQLSPVKVRAMALAWLEGAEAAEQDASTLRTVRKLGLQDELAALIITELRNSREE